MEKHQYKSRDFFGQTAAGRPGALRDSCAQSMAERAGQSGTSGWGTESRLVRSRVFGAFCQRTFKAACRDRRSIGSDFFECSISHTFRADLAAFRGPKPGRLSART